MKTERTLELTERIRTLCIENDYFTCGTNSQYSKMFNMATDPEFGCEDVAAAIYVCSEDADFHTIMEHLMNIMADFEKSEKEWSIDEFVAECDKLQHSPYGYDYNNMPDGICNGHRVAGYPKSLAAVLIDHRIINMGVINDRYPDGHVEFVVKGKSMTGQEYIRYLLERSAP